MKKIQVKLFIVPNAASTYDGCSGNGAVSDPMTAFNICQMADDLRAAKRFGFDIFGHKDKANEIDVSDFWAQVWCHDDEHDNLTDHGIFSDHPLREVADRAPNMLPVKFLEKIAQGGYKTVVEYNCNGSLMAEPIEIEWISSQEETRYRSFGTMASALKHVMSRARAYVRPKVLEAFNTYRELWKQNDK